MSDPIETAASETIRIPANVMGLLRQSYDSREKALDWCLAIGVAAVMAYAFRDTMRGWFLPAPDANAGRDDPPVPSMDVTGALPNGGAANDPYIYNQPASRAVRYALAPSGNPIPANPSLSPAYTPRYAQ